MVSAAAATTTALKGAMMSERIMKDGEKRGLRRVTQVRSHN